MSVWQLNGPIILGENLEVSRAWIVNGKLTLRRPRHGQEVRVVEGFAFPTLVDMHAHIGLAAGGAVSMQTATEQLETQRFAGVGVIRDAGSPQPETKEFAKRDDLPKIIRAGRHIAVHKRYLRYFAEELQDPAELHDVALRQLAAGDGWIKIVADWIDRDIGDLTPLWTAEQLNETFAAVHKAGGRITAHTFAHESVQDLIDAGVDCLEHGLGVSEQQAEVLAALNIPVTATLLQISTFPNIIARAIDKFPTYAARMRKLYDQRYDHIAMLHEAGVPILVGTDAGGTLDHGLIAYEMAEMTKAGLSGGELMAAATWKAREFLGVPAVKPGGSADLVVYDQDPRKDISQLFHPRAVFLAGQRYR